MKFKAIAQFHFLDCTALSSPHPLSLLRRNCFAHTTKHLSVRSGIILLFTLESVFFMLSFFSSVIKHLVLMQSYFENEKLKQYTTTVIVERSERMLTDRKRLKCCARRLFVRLYDR